MERFKKVFLVFSHEFKKIFYKPFIVGILLLIYSFLPLLNVNVVFVLFLVLSGILLSLLLYRFANNPILFLYEKIYLDIFLLLIYWMTISTIYIVLSEFLFEYNTVLKSTFFVTCLGLLFLRATKYLIDLTLGIINDVSKVKIKDPKMNLLATIITIVFIVILTDFIVSIIYSSVILLGGFFGNLTEFEYFTDIKEELNTKTILALSKIFYFTFSIHHSIPLSDGTVFSKFQEVINNSPILFIIQILHVLLAKAIDILILGVVANRFFEYFQSRSLERNSP